MILETGSHPDLAKTRLMAEYALESGAAFLKTSTGKHGPGASLEAAGSCSRSAAAGRREGLRGRPHRGEASGYVMLADEMHGSAVDATDASGSAPPRCSTTCWA